MSVFMPTSLKEWLLEPPKLLGNSMARATFCFAPLFRSFSLRCWLEGFPEDNCKDEYMEFNDHFRHTYSALKNSPEGFTDMVDLLISMPELRSRSLLRRLFRLSNMCLSDDTALLPPIKFQDVDDQSSRCRLSHILLPAQPYLTVVPNGSANCTSEASLAKYKELEQQFNSEKNG